MKRIATLAVILMMGLTASAHSIRYFTESQAVRTVRYLNAQNEMMIYCGYDYEIETYVLINEVWMERVNSAYYEIWVYGYDAYTGDEIYMPLDLGCVWLFSAGRIYNAAQYLRFHTSVRTPSFTWYIPHYNPFTRVMHRPGYVRSYHYDIHRHGWMPPHHHHGPGMPPPPLPPYYMRQPGTPAPHPSNTWTPGVDRPVVTDPSTSGRTGSAGRVINGSQNTGGSSGVRTGGSSRGTSTGTSTGSSRGTSTSGTGSSRGTSTSGTMGSSRGTSTSGTSSSRGTTTGTTPTRGNTTGASGSTRGTSTSAATTESSTDKPKGNTRGTSATTTSSSNRGTSTSGRGTSTTSGSSSNRGTGSSNRGNTGTR